MLREIAYVKQVEKSGVFLFAQDVVLQIELNSPGPVLNVGERAFAHVVQANEPASDSDTRLFVGIGLELRDCLGGRVRSIEVCADRARSRDGASDRASRDAARPDDLRPRRLQLPFSQLQRLPDFQDGKAVLSGGGVHDCNFPHPFPKQRSGDGRFVRNLAVFGGDFGGSHDVELRFVILVVLGPSQTRPPTQYCCRAPR